MIFSRFFRTRTHQNSPILWMRRKWYQSDQKNIVLGSIIGVNVGVFGLWTYADQIKKNMGDSSYMNWMYRNFTLGLHSGPIGYVTAHFSHQSIFHLGINMYVLYSFGGNLIQLLGAGRFLGLYAISGLTTSLASIVR